MKLMSEGFKKPRGEKDSVDSKNTGPIATMLNSKCCQMGRRFLTVQPL